MRSAERLSFALLVVFALASLQPVCAGNGIGEYSASEVGTAVAGLPEPIAMTDSLVDRVLDQARGSPISPPWILIFTAKWCPHCQKLAPSLPQLATALHPNTKVGIVDADSAARSARRLGIRGYPSAILVSDGALVRFPDDLPLDLQSLRRFAGGAWRQPGGMHPVGSREREQAQAEAGRGERDIVTMEPIPASSTWLVEVQEELERGLRDVTTIVASRPDIAAILFALGLMTGVVMSTLAMVFLVDRSVPDAVRARMRPAGPAVAAASAPGPRPAAAGAAAAATVAKAGSAKQAAGKAG